MKKITFALLNILTALALAGCVSPDAEMKRYVGRSTSELISRWGMPLQRMPDGRGGEIWSYSEQQQWTAPDQGFSDFRSAEFAGAEALYGSPTGMSRAKSPPPLTNSYVSQRTFFIDSKGMVYDYAGSTRPSQR